MATEHQNYHARQEKFSYPIRATKSLSTEGIWTCRIWTEWYAQNASLINKTSEVAKLAAQGIVEEGKLWKPNQEVIAQAMADELIQYQDNRQKLRECAVRLYTKETFLYKVLNEALRNDDMSKIKTLGPLCFLINSYISQRKTLTEDQIIYRGMTLTDEMINEYSEAVGEDIDWPAFASTTKNRALAEIWGNTLCFITLCRGLFVHGSDISNISYIPDEDEFLLSVGFVLQVEKVDIDLSKQKHKIYLKTVSANE